MTKGDILVGRRLRIVREAKGLSQRELARRTGVGSGTISQIESAGMQPSVAVLKKILDGVPIDLSSFFSFELAASETPVFRKDDHVDIGSAGIKYLLVAAGRPNRKLQMLHEFYAPGTDTGRRALSHDGEECGVVIRGVLEVTVGDEVHTFRPGDAYYFASVTPHKFRNSGKEECEVVSVCTPPSF